MKIQEQKQMQFEDYIEILLRRKWFIIVPLIFSVIGIIVTLSRITPNYKSSTLILVEPQKVPAAYVTPSVTLSVRDRLSTISQEVMSRTRLESIIKEFDLYRTQSNQLTSDETVEIMRKHIKLEVSGGRGNLSSFTISFIGTEPETVMHVTNRLASLFIEENLLVREQQVEGTTEFLDTQLQGLKKTLEDKELQIKLFKEKYMGELPSQLDANLRTLDRLQHQLGITNESLRMAEDRKIMLEKQISEINSGTNDRHLRRSQLAALRAELIQLSTIYTDNYPDIIRLKREIAELEEGLKRENVLEKNSEAPSGQQQMIDSPVYVTLNNQLLDINKDIKLLKEKQEASTRSIAKIQGRVERIPEREQQMTTLLRDYGNTTKNYQNLLNKRLDSQIAQNLEKRQKGEQFRILDPANLPIKPVEPNTKRIILMGLALGLGSGAGLVILLEFIDASFRKDEDVYNALGLPVLVSIPRIRT